jgi:glycosyltransferase involved in cell wall biosynthesis
MKIVHITTYAPNRCGLYEASRDMMKSDAIFGGHEVYTIDGGGSNGNETFEGKIGQVDDRNGFKITTVHPDVLMDADIVVMHTGINDRWLVKSQAPVICVVHGKPLDCFRPEEKGNGGSYSLYEYIAQWPRTKKMLYFWDTYYDYWKHLFFGKDLVLKYPVIDCDRFPPIGETYQFENPGKYNILICDSVREDINMFETAIACLKIAREVKGVKFHFFAVEEPIKHCWETIFNSLRELGALGDVRGRVTNMDYVFRASHLVMCPNRIINRIVGEAMLCGCPVMQETGALTQIADYLTYYPAPDNVLEIFYKFKQDHDNGLIYRNKISERAKEFFSLENYSMAMNRIYQEII